MISVLTMEVRGMSEDISMEAIKEVLDEFRRLHKSCHELLTVAMKHHEIDISPDQSKLLFLIYHGKFSNQQDLAHRLRITPATLSVRLQRLESAGYLSRKADENDKRNYVLTVEPKGKELVALSHQVVDGVVQEIFSGFAKEDLKVLVEYIDRLKQNVRNIKEDI